MGGWKTLKAEGNAQQNCLQNKKCLVGSQKYFYLFWTLSYPSQGWGSKILNRSF